MWIPSPVRGVLNGVLWGSVLDLTLSSTKYMVSADRLQTHKDWQSGKWWLAQSRYIKQAGLICGLGIFSKRVFIQRYTLRNK